MINFYELVFGEDIFCKKQEGEEQLFVFLGDLFVDLLEGLFCELFDEILDICVVFKEKVIFFVQLLSVIWVVDYKVLVVVWQKWLQYLVQVEDL